MPDAGSRPRPRTRHRRLTGPAAGLAVTLAATGCGSSTATSSPTTIPAPAAHTRPTPDPATASILPRGTGHVTVLYAGSLLNLMEKQIDSAFHSATGFTVQGISAGSTALATEIKGKLHQGDVFISASPTVNASLEGAANGAWVSWYLTFASSPLVLGYNPKSRFAHDLTTKPWYQVVTEPGILIGRTDPTTDPKGKLTVQALTTAATTDQAPGLLTLTRTSRNVFPEETLVGRLQAGQLDAGFFYSSEAAAAGLATIPLTGVSLEATYTITALRHAPNPAGAQSFIGYLLGPSGRSMLSADGFTLVQPPTLTGTGLPAALHGLVGPG